MKKAPNGQFLLGAVALSLAALFTPCQSAPTQTAAELNRLQGYWQGEGPPGKISITITGNSLHYYARPDHWFKTTFTLPAGTDPQQLRATIIKDNSPPKDPNSTIGKVVAAIFKIEDGTLTLATFQDGDAARAAVPPKSFEDEQTFIVLRKVQPQKRNTEPPKTKVTTGETRQREQITGSAWVFEPGQQHPAEIAKIASGPDLFAVPIAFQNNSAGIRKVYWLDTNGERQLYRELKPGESYGLGTYLSHPWVVTDADGNALGLYYPDGQKRTVTLE
jgi:hypothetical protein